MKATDPNIHLEYFNGATWTRVNSWHNEWSAWMSLGGDDLNYRTVDSSGKVLTDKRPKPSEQELARLGITPGWLRNCGPSGAPDV